MKKTPKFIQSLDNQVYLELERLAKERGITVQTLIRAVIVPEWSTLSGADAKHGRASIVEDHSIHHSHNDQLPRPVHHIAPEQPTSHPQVASSSVFHLRHFKPSSFYEEAKQDEDEKQEKDILVYGRKRRHH